MTATADGAAPSHLFAVIVTAGVQLACAALAVTSETAALVTTAAVLMSRCLPMRPARRIASPFSQCAIPLPAEHLATDRAAPDGKTVGLAFAGQRGVIQYTGTKDIHANSGNKIVLRVQKPSEMNKLIEGWELEGMPDMSTYGAGKPGVALIVGPDGTWQAGRVRDLHDLDAVAAPGTAGDTPADDDNDDAA
ncbi:MAG TPA: hypothetical protein VE733_00435 [Streptosporangiaceae bacterium]|nr:hypothetical protein [Streptosporangiaceae bacterium]